MLLQPQMFLDVRVNLMLHACNPARLTSIFSVADGSKYT